MPDGEPVSSPLQVRSMTGFGVGRADSPLGAIQVEVRSVNHRYLEVAVHLPRGLAYLEEPLIQGVRRRLVRGRVDVRVVAQDLPALQRKVRLRTAVLAQYWQQLQEIEQELGIPASSLVGQLLTLPEVVQADELQGDDPRLAQAADEALQQALDRLEAMRRAEGGQLWAAIDARLARIEGQLAWLQERAGEVVSHHAQRLQARVQALLASLSGPPAQALAGLREDEGWQRRLAQEVALSAERSDVAEELERIASHVAQMRHLATQPAAGRRMEFLVREMDREASTAASKVASGPMVHQLIEIRWEIERVREQVLNLE